MTTSLPPDAPAVHPVTARWYGLLPELYRVADQQAGGTVPYPLLNYLAMLGDQLGQVMDVVDRIEVRVDNTVTPPVDRSDLTDPARADAAWLGWLAQLAGVRLTGLEPVQVQRDTIAAATDGWKAGTKGTIAAAARTALTGSQYVQVLDHRTTAGAGGMWDVLVLTRGVETPSDQAIIDAVTAAGAKPAGVKLWMGRTAASWDTLEAKYPTSDAWDATGSWDAIESTMP